MAGYCYLMQDFSSLLTRDLNVTHLNTYTDLEAPAGIFKDVSIEGGQVAVTAAGIHFVPETQDVVITYSTRTCAEFYAQFGGEWPQVCTAQFGLAGQIVTNIGLVTPPKG
eukprot:CAMPEP_0114140620 /NCGR_PEP_ID=MMETSP0043_2-20121206/17480_1 /TAXON_ID=464988 /ORGANISM="Hemiselmis andersenii, Strain CCMP644" /LENGTH=109 /DNA_ID=CAMNT_0001234723 /DNA_START=154 /DNA_END=480 /DNA_ORIENTATION=+